MPKGGGGVVGLTEEGAGSSVLTHLSVSPRLVVKFVYKKKNLKCTERKAVVKVGKLRYRICKMVFNTFETSSYHGIHS